MNRRTFLKLAAGGALLAGGVGGGAWSFLQHPKFGALPEGPELSRILASPHYANGVFHNMVSGPVLSGNGSFALALLRSFFMQKDRPVPPGPVPARRVDLKGWERTRDRLIWLGHSSFLIQLSGSRFLVDPVFSPFAAPVPFSTRAFAGTTPYSVRDMPDIDCLLISHDHWDHLDYSTVMGLKSRIPRVVCPLGVGAHFRRWGFSDSVVHEADWGDVVDLKNGNSVFFVTSHHYSGRTLTRNKALWGGFVLDTPRRRVFYSGDGGYGPHFKTLGDMFGGIDLALLDGGQYNERWRAVHMTPEEAVQAAEDVRAKALIPAHVGKFSLAYHAWDEPFRRIVAASRGKRFQLVTPEIGEPVEIADSFPAFPHWWERLA